MALSKRGESLLGQSNFMRECSRICNQDPYDAAKNPKGFVNLGTAQNRLNDDLVLAKLKGHFHTRLHPQMVQQQINVKYPLQSSAPVDPDHIVALCGTCCAFDVVAQLTSEPGDAFLCPVPVYTRVRNNFGERGGVDLVPVQMDVEEDFGLRVEKLDAAWKECTASGRRITGLVLVNPSNPLCSLLSKETLLDVLNWAASKELWVFADEIYAVGVLDDGGEHVSVLGLEIPYPQRTLWAWGLSKDFGLAGLRVSFLHSANEEFLAAARRLASFQFLAGLWADPSGGGAPSLRRGLADRLLRGRVKRSLTIVSKAMEDMGVKILPAKAGLFIFADFGRFLKERSIDGDKELFRMMFHEAKVNIVPGTELLGEEAGWFRITHTGPEDALREGLRRLKDTFRNPTQ